MDFREKAMEAVFREYDEFRDRVLRMESRRIWERCRRIQFYCYIREYFEYNEKIEFAVVKFTVAFNRPVQVMWEFYLKNENCHCDTWEEITEMIHTMMAAKERGETQWRTILKTS